MEVCCYSYYRPQGVHEKLPETDFTRGGGSIFVDLNSGSDFTRSSAINAYIDMLMCLFVVFNPLRITRLLIYVLLLLLM